MIGFIVNPIAGNGRGATAWRDVESVLKQRNIAYSVSFTRLPTQARALARDLIRAGSTKMIVAVGGDGTVNEVVHGICDSDERCLFGYIAAGSGNDFARGHGLPIQPVAALELILASAQAARAGVAVDVLEIADHVAVSSIGVGLDGQVAKVTNESSYKRWFNLFRIGKLSYVLSLIRILFTYQPCHVSLTIDGTTTSYTHVWLIAITNVPYYGGGMRICPYALPDDGIAEICIVSRVSRWELLRVFPLVFSGKHEHHRAVQFLRGRNIHIHSERPLVAQTDGETVLETPLHIQVLPRRIDVVK